MLHSLTLPASTWLAQSSEETVGGGMVIFYLLLIVVSIVGMWKMFEKAGKPGWAAIIPIYNVWVLLEIVGRPGWWIILMIIPIVSIIVSIIVMIDLARSFGKGAGFAIGLVFLGFIFLPILGFGSATYKGPAAKAA